MSSGTAKKSRLLPRSFSKTRSPREAAHTSAMGPKYFSAGSCIPTNERLVAAQRSRFSAR
jgi:hypothetical protein